MSIPDRLANRYRLPCIVTTQVNNDNDACYLLRDADGKPLCAAGTDFVLAATIRDALNQPYYQVLEAAKERQEHAARFADSSRIATGDSASWAQLTSAKLYAEARDMMNIVEIP